MSVMTMAESSTKENGVMQGNNTGTASGEEQESVVVAEIKRHVEVIDMAVAANDMRLQSRVLRQTSLIRRKLTPQALVTVIKKCLPKEQTGFSTIMKFLSENGDAMDIDKVADKDPKKGLDGGLSNTTVPEVSAYLQLLCVTLLIDRKRYDDLVQASTALVDYVASFNRRTMDDVASRAYFFYSRAHELTDKLALIRPRLLSAYRTAVLRHNHIGQGMLLNLLLRNYIHYSLYDQADKLVTRTQFPETRSNNQLARYLYFNGRIKAIQLDYSEALQCLLQAQRKAPQGSALGFRIAVQKFIFIVQLLTGEIPDRAAFRQSNMKRALYPYLMLTKSVRVGDLHDFQEVVGKYEAVFKRDNTMTLITRLRQNVLKTGLRKINSSYSRISLDDICQRLGLDSKEDAEGVVTKAIRDGVIDAVIDHKAGAVRSRENLNTYATDEPTQAYHNRVEFCLNIYSEAIRAMRFPDSTEDDANAEARRERLKEEQELAKTFEEDEEDLDDDF
mmetsp:Transcript_4378/g.13259  ORF Transcript_4378/g.13259 Transcript_4378/m.13259 type:complete len:503 (+) Transcript_4378:214-1722(+)